MSNLYLWLKLIHIVGAAMFLGNIVVTGWWKNMADLTKNPQVIAFAQRQVTLTDYIFTAGGSLILFVAAMANVGMHKIPLNTHWITWGMGLFILSGIIWAVELIPTQMKQAKMARAFAEDGNIPDAYWELCRRWNFWGAIATLTPLFALYWMVLKPA